MRDPARHVVSPAVPRAVVERAAGARSTSRLRLRYRRMRSAAGDGAPVRLEAANRYRLTADGMIMAVEFLLEHAPVGCYYMPSMPVDARCVEQLPGSTPSKWTREVAQGRTMHHCGAPSGQPHGSSARPFS